MALMVAGAQMLWAICVLTTCVAVTAVEVVAAEVVAPA